MVEWHHWFSGHELGQTLGDGKGQGDLAGWSPWGLEELDATWQLNSKWQDLPRAQSSAHDSQDSSRLLQASCKMHMCGECVCVVHVCVCAWCVFVLGGQGQGWGGHFSEVSTSPATNFGIPVICDDACESETTLKRKERREKRKINDANYLPYMDICFPCLHVA